MSHNHTQHPHGNGTFTSYTLGFISSIVLTLVPYALVTQHLVTSGALIAIVVLCAITQLVVQMIAFLHLSAHAKARINLVAFVFTATMIWIIVIGSLWIMNNLAKNMTTDQLDAYMHMQN